MTEKEINKGGRPPIYETTEEIGLKIEEYFETRKPEYAKDADGEEIITPKGRILVSLNAPSVTGMALYLGYASRQSIYDNEEKQEFSYIIKKAKSRVEEWVYQASMSGLIKDSVGIFILKQFGYSDNQMLEIKDSREKVLTREEKEARLKELEGKYD